MECFVVSGLEDLVNLSLCSERLSLVATSENYCQEIFDNFTEKVAAYMVPRPHLDIEETRSFVRDCQTVMLGETCYESVILHKVSGEFLGLCGMHRVNSRTPEIGIWLKEGAWGHSYGLEAVGILLEWARQTISFDYVVYPVDERNLPSRRIAAHYGGRICRIYNCLSESGFELHVYEYHIPGSEPTVA